MATERDYYEVLGVARTAGDGEIAAAYRRLAIKYHPDKNPGDEDAIERFKEAAEAFEVLNDPAKRSRYDRYGHAGVNGDSRGHHFHDVEDIFSAFGDIFGDLFGGGRNRPRKGRDVRCDITLTLHEAAQGVTKTVEFQRHERCDGCQGTGAAKGSRREICSYCRGQGRVIQSAGIVRMQTTCPACHGEGSTVKNPCTACRGTGQKLRKVVTDVEIPAGVDDEMRVRITGQGEPSPNTWFAVCRSPIRRRRWARRSKCRRSKGAASWRCPPARSRARCFAWAAKACPTRDGADWATCWCKSSSKYPKS
jgi:molecular chaperone DnaJ